MNIIPVLDGLRTSKIRILIIVFFITSQYNTFGAGLWSPAGARQAGLNHCSVALSDFWSIQNNQAGMALIKNLSVGVAYESRYLVSQMGTANLALVYPLKFGNMGVSMSYFGYALYHEMKMGLAYARSFGPHLRAGVQLDYLQTGLGDIYGSRSNVTFELGVQSDVTEHLTFGAYVYNPVRVKFSDYAREKIPAVFRFGFAYHFSDKLLTTAEVEKNTDYQSLILRGGIEYRYKKQFFFRVGFGTSRDIFSFGFGWHKKHMQFDIGTTMHQTLGFSPQTSLVFAF